MKMFFCLFYRQHMALKSIMTTDTVWCRCLVATQAISSFTYCCFCIISANTNTMKQSSNYDEDNTCPWEPLFLPGSVEHTLRNIAVDHFQEVCSVSSVIISVLLSIMAQWRNLSIFRLVTKRKNLF